MRKLFALLSVAAVMSLASCGAKSDESATAADSTMSDSTNTVPESLDSAVQVLDSAVQAVDSISKEMPAAH